MSFHYKCLAFFVGYLATIVACGRSVERAQEAAASVGLDIAMRPAELKVMYEQLCADTTKVFLEFGSGGSTLVAAACNVSQILSVDSSSSWLVDTAAHPIWNHSSSVLRQFHVDIGPLRNWGRSRLKEHHGFKLYSSAYLYTQEKVDFLLVDGRFRVACALKSIRMLRSGAVMAVHDYLSRPQYHVLEKFYNRENCAANLCLFRPRLRINVTDLHITMLHYDKIQD